MNKREENIRSAIVWGVCVAHMWWMLVAVDIYFGWLTSTLPVIMGGVLAVLNTVLFGLFMRMTYTQILEKKHGRKRS